MTSGIQHVLTPGRYVGAEALQAEDEPFEARYSTLLRTLDRQFAEGRRLEGLIRDGMGKVAGDR